MPVFTINKAPFFSNSDYFTQAYVEAMFWTNQPEGLTEVQEAIEAWQNQYGGALVDIRCNTLGVADLAPVTVAAILVDCARFQALISADIRDSAEFDDQQAGHDFWLTRAETGSGFWDGDWPEHGEELTRIVKEEFPNQDLYVGDDGLIYIMGREEYKRIRTW